MAFRFMIISYFDTICSLIAVEIVLLAKGPVMLLF